MSIRDLINKEKQKFYDKRKAHIERRTETVGKELENEKEISFLKAQQRNKENELRKVKEINYGNRKEKLRTFGNNLAGVVSRGAKSGAAALGAVRKNIRQERDFSGNKKGYSPFTLGPSGKDAYKGGIMGGLGNSHNDQPKKKKIKKVVYYR